MLLLGACSTVPFSISRESINALKPDRVAVTSIRATGNGARIVVFGFAPVAIANFLRQLELAGVTNIQLLEIKPFTACGMRVMRAEFQISGDTSKLAEVNSSTEQFDHLLGKNNKESSCTSTIPM